MKQLLSLFTMCLLVLGFSTPSFAQDIYNCDDFDTWKEAQHFFNTKDPNNENGLDGNDKDGIVCESLPGFDVNYQAGTPLGDVTTDIPNPENDNGAGLAETATYYPVGGAIGLIIGTIGLILFLFKKRTIIE